MIRPRTVLMLGVAAAGYAVARHLMRPGMSHHASGGVLIGDAGIYDMASRVLLGPFYRGIAENVGGVAPSDGRVLEIGCGPGHLTIELAGRGLEVTGLDLDPSMIERARANTKRRLGPSPLVSFDVGDAAALPYPDDSFDLVVSTLSLHHWTDPAAALAEIARVLHAAGRALIWDLGPGFQLLHGRMPDPGAHLHDSPLQLIESTPWRWPLGFALTHRMSLVRHQRVPPD